MPCEHFQPQDLIKLAENHCLEKGVSEASKKGLCYRYTENLDENTGQWGHKSIVTEVTYKENQWMITRLDRNPEYASEEEVGFKQVL
jgi:hypothetical protein